MPLRTRGSAAQTCPCGTVPRLLCLGGGLPDGLCSNLLVVILTHSEALRPRAFSRRQQGTSAGRPRGSLGEDAWQHGREAHPGTRCPPHAWEGTGFRPLRGPGLLPPGVRHQHIGIRPAQGGSPLTCRALQGPNPALHRSWEAPLSLCHPLPMGPSALPSGLQSGRQQPLTVRGRAGSPEPLGQAPSVCTSSSPSRGPGRGLESGQWASQSG